MLFKEESSLSSHLQAMISLPECRKKKSLVKPHTVFVLMKDMWAWGLLFTNPVKALSDTESNSRQDLSVTYRPARLGAIPD